MPTPREVIESFLGGEPVDGVSLRAAVGVLLTGWDETLASARHLASSEVHEVEDRVVELLNETMTWHDLMVDCEADPWSARALPQFMARRRACMSDGDAQSSG